MLAKNVTGSSGNYVTTFAEADHFAGTAAAGAGNALGSVVFEQHGHEASADIPKLTFRTFCIGHSCNQEAQG